MCVYSILLHFLPKPIMIFILFQKLVVNKLSVEKWLLTCRWLIFLGWSSLMSCKGIYQYTAMWENNTRKICDDCGASWIMCEAQENPHIGLKDNPHCRIPSEPWILTCNESLIMKPAIDRKAYLRKTGNTEGLALNWFSPWVFDPFSSSCLLTRLSDKYI